MIFKNPAHQKEYDNYGYIIIDFLSKSETATLLEKFNHLSPWFKDGFLASVYMPENGYKQEVDSLLQPYGERIVEKYMMNYETIIGTFMAKGFGENSAMYPHQDWTLVDEHNYASFNAWIPLVDVDHKNGAMSIMRGGHKMPFTKRGSNVPDALINYEMFYADKLTYTPLKAGQALIYDHRCIHVSPPNKTKQVRPVCAIGLVPKNVDVYHYYFDKDRNELSKFKASKEFYFNHVFNQFEKPKNAELIDEQENPLFNKFSTEELLPFFKNQVPRKKSLLEKIFNS